MVFSGAKRISDVLAFGSLRNVVNLGREGALPVTDSTPEPKKQKETETKVNV
jgi:lysyl-tRNA synthetase class 2